MATSEERLKILQMIQEEKISAADGAKLLEALAKGAGAAPPSGSLSTEGRYMRVRVTNLATGKNKVSVNLPLSLVDAGMNIASSFVPDIATDDIREAISKGLTGKIVEVTDGDDQELVEVYIE
jgi:hypothetical protein